MRSPGEISEFNESSIDYALRIQGASNREYIANTVFVETDYNQVKSWMNKQTGTPRFIIDEDEEKEDDY